MPEAITSAANEKIKKLVRLREKKERDRTGLTIIDGEREILRALQAGAQIVEIYGCGKVGALTLRLLKEKAKAGPTELAPHVFEKIAYGQRSEGLLAVARVKPKSLSALKLSDPALVLVLEGVEKPGNLGAVLRSCDGAGVDGVILTEAATDLYNPNTIRASLGSIFAVDVLLCSNKEAHDFLKQNKLMMLATSPDAQKNYAQFDMKRPLAVIMGSEDKGLSDFWLESSDAKAFIPMKGVADSLNVSASAAIMLYEAIRQRST